MTTMSTPAGKGGDTPKQGQDAGEKGNLPPLADETGAKAGKSKRNKAPPPGLVIPPPRPKLSKAERRAKQEQQKAAKEAQRQQESGGGKKGESQKQQQQPKKQPQQQQQQQKSSSPKAAAHTTTTTTSDKDDSLPSWVSHIPAYRKPETLFHSGGVLGPRDNDDTSGRHHNHHHHHQLHPVVLETAYLYATGNIRGGNARCRAMLQCFRHVLRDFVVPAQQQDDWRHVLTQHVLNPSFDYLTTHGRPHCVSMGNAFTFIKTSVAQCPRDQPYDRNGLIDTLSSYEEERIDLAGTAIAEVACRRVFDGSNEVLLVYGYSEVILAILRRRATSQAEEEEEGATKNMRVMVVGGGSSDGMKMVTALRESCPNIHVTYILLNALTYVMTSVTTVLLGAVALQSDGAVMGRAGTAMVALAAESQNVPVLVACETYKISNRVQLESLTHNELDAAPTTSSNSLPFLNLRYDLTPASLVRGIVTEMGIVPPTSVAVLLREMNPQ